MVKIIKNICSKSYSSNNVKYIVVHYTASPNGTAKSVSNYFKTSAVKSSAHYVVDDNSIYQCVEENRGAWHAGNSFYNKHSIGIEICCKKTNTSTLNATDSDWYFTNNTLNNVLDLIWDLQKRYPNAKIIRHYDVTKKICPAPFVNDKSKYEEFLNKISSHSYYGIVVSSLDYVSSSFKVKVTADALNIRKSPTVSSTKTGCIRDKGIYTIVEEKNGWGKLKSGAGWIRLKYTKKL